MVSLQLMVLNVALIVLINRLFSLLVKKKCYAHCLAMPNAASTVVLKKNIPSQQIGENGVFFTQFGAKSALKLPEY